VIRLESQHDLAFSREAVWPVLSRTDWLNRSLGLPAVDYHLERRAEGGSRAAARARVFGQEMRWLELPFEWLEPEFYRVHRIFEAGPFLEARMGMDFADHADGTRVVVYSELVPRNVLGKWLAQRLLGPKTQRDMRRIVAHTAEFLRGASQVALPRLPVQPVNETVLQNGLRKLLENGQPPDLVQLLEAFLRQLAGISRAVLQRSHLAE
jgi:hypothetical protein